VLALVAIATAWSGYQAAKWDGQQSVLYGTASAYRFRADAASTYGGQELAADASMFTAWLQATSAHDSKLAALDAGRFTPDYRTAFQAWLKTDPFTNPGAPAGPSYMPQYRNPDLVAAAQLNNRAKSTVSRTQSSALSRAVVPWAKAAAPSASSCATSESRRLQSPLRCSSTLLSWLPSFHALDRKAGPQRGKTGLAGTARWW